MTSRHNSLLSILVKAGIGESHKKRPDTNWGKKETEKKKAKADLPRQPYLFFSNAEPLQRSSSTFFGGIDIVVHFSECQKAFAFVRQVSTEQLNIRLHANETESPHRESPM